VIDNTKGSVNRRGGGKVSKQGRLYALDPKKTAFSARFSNNPYTLSGKIENPGAAKKSEMMSGPNRVPPDNAVPGPKPRQKDTATGAKTLTN